MKAVLQMSHVPNFCVDEPKLWFVKADEWAAQFGLGLIMIAYSAPMGNSITGNRYWLAGGGGPRGLPHEVVYFGRDMVHDPHPDGSGLVKIGHCILFVLRDPAGVRRKEGGWMKEVHRINPFETGKKGELQQGQWRPEPRTHKVEVEAIRRAVGLMGGACNVLSQGHRLRGSAGIPDMYVQFPERPYQCAFWVEVKVGKDKLRPAQVAFKAREEQAGGVVIVGDLAVVLEYVENRGSHKTMPAQLKAAYADVVNGKTATAATEITEVTENGKAVE